ncbi:MAG: TonB-dependent receptor [Candidatus Marinimicrobia bacterium]|nr:TonB-dependent receptor [Candidatus Neomarinimicrobiota bacterium]
MRLVKLLVAMLLIVGIAFAGTSGKISGFVRDADTGDPLPGANVLLNGTSMGAAANAEGYFVILNIPPGTYDLVASYVGYARLQNSENRVMIDRLTTIDFDMKVEAFAGEEVVVTAKRDLIQKDNASGQLNVSSDEIEALPVTTISEVLSLKAGVSGMSVRGGGSDETAFMLDGITQRDARTNEPITTVPLSAIGEVSVQTGGFSVRYDDARSGVVSVVTKEGKVDKYSGTVSMRMSPAAPKNYGISVYDPNGYWLYPYLNDDVAWTGTNRESFTDLNGNGTWDEHEPLNDVNGNHRYDVPLDDYAYDQIKGNYFNGWESAAMKTLQNAGDANDLTASGAQQVFRYEHRKDGQIYQSDYNMDIGFGGPVPVLSKFGNMRFYASYFREQTMYLIPLTTDGLQNQSGMLKITTDIGQKGKLSLTGRLGSLDGTSASTQGYSSYFSSAWGIANRLDRSGFTVPWRIFTWSYFSHFRRYDNSLAAKYTQQLTEKSFFDVSVSRTQTRYLTGPDALRDTAKTVEVVPGYFLDEHPTGYWPYNESSIDGKVMHGGSLGAGRDSTITATYMFDANYKNQVSENNELNAGIKFQLEDIHIDFGAKNLMLPDGNEWNDFHYKPYRLTAWAEDKLEYEGFYATLGIKGMYFNPNCDWYFPATYDPTFFTGNFDEATMPDSIIRPAQAQWYITPVLAISHPISENAKLFFNYGHFIQKINTQTMFRYEREMSQQLNYLGNPEAAFERTIAYELGFDMSMFDMYTLHLSAYYKDIKNQASWTDYVGLGGQVNYSALNNRYYQDIRGFELELKKVMGDWFTGWVNFEYRVSSSGYFGVGVLYDNDIENREYLENNPYQSKPLPRPRFKAYFDIHTPKYLSNPILADWHLAVIPTWTAGSYTTWNPKNAEDIRGARITYNTKYVDYYNIALKLSKKLKITDKISLKVFADVSNALNTKRFSNVAYYDTYDYYDYMYSLHFPAEIGDPLDYGNIPGTDKPGVYRDLDVEYVPMQYVEDIASFSNGKEGILYFNDVDDDYYVFSNGVFTTENDATVDQIMKDKAYIDMPAFEALTFLNPRNIFFGVNVSFDF